MNNIKREELVILLGFYYFDWKKSDSKVIQKFTDRFNDIYKRDLSNQLTMYYCTLFKNVDSSYNAKPINNDDSRIYELWTYYIIGDRIDELKNIYRLFKKKSIPDSVIVLDEEFETKISNVFSDCVFTYVEDKPKEKYDAKKNDCKKSMRDINVSFNALKIANFLCEVDKQHTTFIRKNTAINYTEGHHIIPLKYQDKFDVNLDVEANIVSLCSNCHNNLHYGSDYESILRTIFTQERKQRLLKCGIDISIEELIDMYR